MTIKTLSSYYIKVRETDAGDKLEHVISSEQFTQEKLAKLFDYVDRIKAVKKFGNFSDSLKGKLIATIFYEPSTRTRLSFESAVLRLGGQIISTENAKEMSSAIKGESLVDTISVISGYCDGIILRHSDKHSAEIAASCSTVPVINAGSGSGEHPTQALLDIYTIYDKKRELNGLKVAVVGDLLFGRTIHSLIKLLSLYKDITIYGVSQDVLNLPDVYKEYMQEHGVKYVECNSLSELPNDIDVIYQTRTQKERFEEDLDIHEHIVNKETFVRFTKAILMHPLPRNNEIADDVDQDERSVYFEQAWNGMYVRMGLLHWIFNG